MLEPSQKPNNCSAAKNLKKPLTAIEISKLSENVYQYKGLLWNFENSKQKDCIFRKSPPDISCSKSTMETPNLWIDLTLCFGISIVDFEQVDNGWAHTKWLVTVCIF